MSTSPDIEKNSINSGGMSKSDSSNVQSYVKDADHQFDVLEVSKFKDADQQLVIDTVVSVDEYTPAQFRRLRIKIDLIILPLMWASYGLMQADKTATSTQATFGLRQDTHLVGQQFSWLSTIFYISFLVFEFPGNWVMQRVHVGKTLGVLMVLWGIVVGCISAAHNFTELMVIRFIQGALECVIAPAYLIITGAYYTTAEHTLRVILWGTANASFGAITDLCNYGIARHIQVHPGGIAPWRAISLFLGSFTVFMGILAFFFMGTPREVRWLSAEEKRMAAARTVNNLTGTDRQKREKWQWEQFREVFRDPQCYFMFFTVLINALPNGALTTFTNLVFVGLGFSPLDTLIEGTVPRNLLGFVIFVALGFLTLYKPGLRFYVMMGCLLPSIIGMFLLAFLPNTPHYLWPKWGCFFFSVTGNVSGLLIQTFVPSNVSGRTKKSVTLSLVFIAYCAGNAAGAQIMQASDAPRYIHGVAVCGALYGLELTVMACWRIYYAWENRRRDRIQVANGTSDEERTRLGRINAEVGMTDRANIHFRYDV